MDKSNTKAEIFENLEMGRTYVIQLSSGALISGGLVAQYEYFTEDEVKKIYRIALGNSKIIDITEEEIESVKLVKPHKTVLEYFEKFREIHAVNCFNDDGELLPNSVILGKVMDKDVWDTLLEEEKRKLLEYLRLNESDEVEVINVYMDYKEEIEKLRKQRLNALNAVIQAIEKINDVKKSFPGFEKIIRILYKNLSIQELIDSI